MVWVVTFRRALGELAALQMRRENLGYDAGLTARGLSDAFRALHARAIAV